MIAAALGGAAGAATGGAPGAIVGATAAETAVETGKNFLVRDEPSTSPGTDLAWMSARSLFENTIGEVLGGVAGRLRSPLGRGAAEPARVELRAAAEGLISRTGLTVGSRHAEPENLLDIGTLTGSRSFERLQALIEKMPGTNLYRDKIAQDAAMVDLRRSVSGAPADAAATGEEAVRILQEQFNADMKVLDTADRVTEDLTGTRITAAGQGPRLGPVVFTPVFAKDAAELSRTGYRARRNAFRIKENELGGRVQNAPGGQDKIVSTEPLVKLADELLGKGIQRQGKPVASGLVDASGRPIMTEGEGSPINAFIPAEVRSDLKALVEAEPKTTITAMRMFRQHVYSALENPEALGGFGQAQLKQLGAAATQALHGAEADARKAGNAALADAMQELRIHHASNVDKFSERGVIDLSRQPLDPSEKPPASLFVNPAKAGDTDILGRYKSFFGEDSVEWSANVSSVWNEMLSDARDPLSGQVDAKALAQSMKNLRTNGSAGVLFGEAQSREIEGALDSLSTQQRIIDPRKLQGSSDPLVVRIRGEQAAARRATLAYRNAIIEPFMEGELSAEVFTLKSQRDQFVRFLSTKGTEAEARTVMRRLEAAGTRGMEALSDIRAQVTQDLLTGAARKGELHELERGTGGQIIEGMPITAQRLKHAMDTAYGESPLQSNRRLHEILGDEGYQNLRDMITVETGRSERSRTGSAMGGLASGSAWLDLVKGLQGASDIVKYQFVSRLLTFKGTKRWLSGRYAKQATMTGHGAAIFAGQLASHLVRGFTGREQEIVKRAIGISEPAGTQPVDLSEESP
jgi:hypothetical protein